MRTVIDITKMQDSDGVVWDVVLEVNGANQPLVYISKERSPVHSYLASTFVGIGGRTSGFNISPVFDEPVIEFSHDQWLPACIGVLNAIPRSAGELDVRWIPDDPSLPF